MKLAPPQRGAVLRYAYLWADEQRRGKEEGRKDRPVLVMAVSVVEREGSTQLLVLAITHSRPKSPTDAVALPRRVRNRLGLGEQDSWIVTTEANAFVWPGPDIRPVPGRKPPTVIYGHVPDGVLQEAARSFLGNRARQRAQFVKRTR